MQCHGAAVTLLRRMGLADAAREVREFLGQSESNSGMR
jgi:hypothetical protein